MNSKKVNSYIIVIMDGSDKKIVDSIMAIINCITNKRHGEATRRSLDDNHLTMTVVESKMTEEAYKLIMTTLEINYPGLCIYNPII